MAMIVNSGQCKGWGAGYGLFSPKRCPLPKLGSFLGLDLTGALHRGSELMGLRFPTAQLLAT